MKFGIYDYSLYFKESTFKGYIIQWRGHFYFGGSGSGSMIITHFVIHHPIKEKLSQVCKMGSSKFELCLSYKPD